MATRVRRKAPKCDAPVIDYQVQADFERLVKDHFISSWSHTDEWKLEACRTASINYRPAGQPFQVRFNEERRVTSHFEDGKTSTRTSRVVALTVDGHWTDTVECWVEYGNHTDPRVQTKVSSGGRMSSPMPKYTHCVAVENDEDALQNLAAAIAFITEVAREYRAEITKEKS